MIEQILTPLISGAVGVLGGGFVTMKVLEERVKNQGDLFDSKLAHVSQRVDKQELAMSRAVYRDTCDACKEGKEDRHDEVVRRLESLESAFRSCFDDLVATLREK